MENSMQLKSHLMGRRTMASQEPQSNRVKSSSSPRGPGRRPTLHPTAADPQHPEAVRLPFPARSRADAKCFQDSRSTRRFVAK